MYLVQVQQVVEVLKSNIRLRLEMVNRNGIHANRCGYLEGCERLAKMTMTKKSIIESHC